jgi:hypothetical protein
MLQIVIYEISVIIIYYQMQLNNAIFPILVVDKGMYFKLINLQIHRYYTEAR